MTKTFLSRPSFICAAGSGADVDSFVNNLKTASRAGIKKVECSLVGESGVKSFFVGKVDDALIKPTGDKYNTRTLELLNFALFPLKGIAEEAVGRYGAERVAVCIGQCDNGSALSFAAHKEFFTDGKFDKEYELKMQGADYVATFAQKVLGTKGPALSFATACSSSASAIIKARQLIESNLADAVICGGVDIASDTVLLGFDSLEAVSHNMTNPFSKNRDGINLGEGAALFVLSRDDLDNQSIILAGCGESSDASHLTAPLADGSGAKSAMQKALEQAGLKPSQIDYINLHGTGTRLNDSMESFGVDLVFNKYKVPVSTTKPLTGHTLGAAAALELAVCFYAIKNQFLPVQNWDGKFDDELPELNFVSSPEVAPERPVRCCMSNSFAFGGANASLILMSE